MTSFRERRFQSRHDKPKGNMRYLVILVFLFALAIWILSVDLENASWLQWMTESSTPTVKSNLVDQKYFQGNATCGYSMALNHPIWVSAPMDSTLQMVEVQEMDSRYLIHGGSFSSPYDSMALKFSFCLDQGALPIIQELFGQSGDWVEEWGKLAMVNGIVKTRKQTGKINQTYCPDSLFFAFMQLDREPPQTLGFILPNRWTDETLIDLAVTVNHIEAMTGIGLFNDVISESVASKIESDRSVLTWGYKDAYYQKRLESSTNEYE